MKNLALSLAMGFAMASTAMAEDPKFTLHGEVEGWKVFIDHEKNTCLIERMDELGNVVQMGPTKDRTLAYIGVFTLAETDVKRGETNMVKIALGPNVYTGEATGMRGNITEGYTGGYILTDNPQMIEDVAKQYVMTVFPETSYAFSIDLTGTFKAIEAATACNAELS
jgi:hypothetical protein